MNESTKLRVKNNRRNGKRYEGELVRLLRDQGISARLGRSNEEGDVILPEYNIVLEAKSTRLKGKYHISMSPDQYFRLRALGQTVYYAIRFKGKGISGWELLPF